MKCHYVYDKIAGKVLIPGCWSVVDSNDIEDCTCRDEDITFAQFQRERYNQEIEKRNAIIKELREEVKYLYEELEGRIYLLNKEEPNESNFRKTALGVPHRPRHQRH